MSSESNKPKSGIKKFISDRVASVRDATASALRHVASKVDGPQARFEVEGTEIDFQLDLGAETIWATQQQMADLFGVQVPAVSKHIANIYEEGELDRDPTLSNLETVRTEGARQVTRSIEHYSLDMILAVGYRVSSRRATQFRQWATSKLGTYLRDGYVLNEERLRSDPAAVQSLAERVREIRYDEKNLYARVRDCVVMVASDYDGNSEQVRSFFARMQDKFHYAACEKTAQQIVLTRADGTKERMGMTTQLNARPTLADAKIAKNYLSEDELKLQYIAGDAFFVYVENAIARKRTMTTAQLLAKIDEVFKFNEIPEFPGYVGPYLKPKVEAHVKTQYDLFKSRTAQDRYDEARRLPRG